MKIRTSLLVGVALCSAVEVRASDAVDARPGSMVPGARALAEVPLLVLSPVDVAAAVAEDTLREGQDVPIRFALPIAVSISPDTDGLWEKVEGGQWLWRLRLASRGARSLNLGFDHYLMPPGGRMLVYSADMSQMVRAFTAEDNATHGELWTPVVPGEEVVVDVLVGADAKDQLDLRLAAVNHDYRGFSKLAFEKSGACNVDVTCPQGNAWPNQIRSVARFTISGAFLCTGAMINNTQQDSRPFFLTANHCSVTSGNAATVVTYWNYQNSTCRTPGSAASGQPGNGSLSQFETGTIFRATLAATDFTLLELDAAPNPAWNIHWAGWDRTGADVACSPSQPCPAIHHPSGDEKRISLSDRATATTSFASTASPGDGTHIWVKWARSGPAGGPTNGITEPGSSGSPMFDNAGRIIGQLHGGASSCSATGDNVSDFYGKLARSWTGGGSNASRLSDWLDPTSTGATTLNGRDQGCNTAPSFAGLQAVAAGSCALNLSWNAATPACGTGVTYNVYRSTSPTFTPNVGNRIARCLSGTSYSNTSVSAGTRYYYVVRAEDNSGGGTGPCGGNEDANVLVRNQLATGGATVRFSDNFEAGGAQWVTGALVGSGVWSIVTTAANSPVSSAFIDDPAVIGDRVLEQAASLALGAGAELRFFHRVSTEATFDGGVLEYSTNAGANWQDILAGNGSTVPANAARFLQNGYNGTLNNTSNNPIGGRSAWSGSLGIGAFLEVRVNLADFAGQSVRFRFRMGSDEALGGAGWWVDDVSIVESTACAAAGPFRFHTLTPCRLADTRSTSALSFRGERSFPVAGLCGVPSAARAISANLTITGATGDGNLRVYPGGTELPGSSNLNYRAGQTRANSAVLKLGDGGAVTAFCNQAMGSCNFILDVNGYFQ